MLRRVLLVSLTALLAAAPALAAPADTSTQSQRTTGQTQEQARRLIASADILGRPLETSDGEQVGRLDHVVVDLRSGRAAYVLVRGEGKLDSGDRYVPVPWQALDASGAGQQTVPVNATLDKLAQAPTLPYDQLANLLAPDMTEELWTYYALPTTAQQAWQPEQGGPPGQATARDEPGLIIIGEQTVHTLAGPQVATPAQLKAADITDLDGDVIGDIRQVVFDAAHGRVAYVVMQDTRQQARVNVPFDSLQWAGRSRFTLDKQAEGAATTASQPLDAQQLGSLYQEWGVEPYWR